MIYRKFPYKTDWLESTKIFNESIKAIESKFKIDRTHDIPYVAGYSKDGKIIFIDKDMPESFKNKTGKTIKTDKYLILHEAIEITLIKAYNEIYQLAHQIALRVERDAVESNGISWKEYNDFMMKYVKKIGDIQQYKNIPHDLDLMPYTDEDQKIVNGILKKYKPIIKRN